MTNASGRPTWNLQMMSDLRNAIQQLVAAQRDGNLLSTGHWTLDQCCQHLGKWICGSLEGFSFQYPWRYRLFGRMVRLVSWQGLVALATRPGFRNPPVARDVEPDTEIPDGAGVAFLLQQLDRIDAGERMQHASPVEGSLSHEQWWYFHLRHAELHLGFQKILVEEGDIRELLVEIEVPVLHTNLDRPVSETLEVIPLSAHRFRLMYSPGLVEGVAKGDVIEFPALEPSGFRVVERSGNLCIWFAFPEPGRNRGPDGDRVRAAVEKFGGVCDGGGNTNLVFSVSVRYGFPAIEALFQKLAAEQAGASWSFGNVFDPDHPDQPIGWWEDFAGDENVDREETSSGPDGGANPGT
jgi:Domain of unknown function (DUF4265)/Protein of unknown function (DUF1569)